MPKVSPKSSLKNGPTTPCGSVPRMSPTFLRTLYQTSAISAGGADLLQIDEDRRLPGRRVAADGSRWRVSCNVRSSRSVTCFSVSSTVAPGQAAATIMVRMVIAGSSPRPRRRNDSDAGDDRHDHHEDDQRGPLQPPFREVGADHCLASSRRTFWPGRSAWTPAVTTTSPGVRPDATSTRSGRTSGSRSRASRRSGLRIDDPHRGLPVGAGHRGRRNLDARPSPASFMRPSPWCRGASPPAGRSAGP